MVSYSPSGAPALASQPLADVRDLPGALLHSILNQQYIAHLQATPSPFYLLNICHLPPGTTNRAHSHPCVALHGCVQGSVTFLTGQGEEVLDAGVLYVLAPGTRHHWRNDGP